MILVFIQAYGKVRKLTEGQDCKFLTISAVFKLLKIKNQKFCYIEVIVFDPGYQPLTAIWTQKKRSSEKIVKNMKKSEPFNLFGVEVNIF